MQLTAFFIYRLAKELKSYLTGFKLGEAFSQNKDEIVLGFYKKNEEFYIKAGLSAQFTFLSFPEDFKRAKKNSVNLFQDFYDLEITRITAFENERAFRIDFSYGKALLFKMYGKRSNIIAYKNTKAEELFKKKMKEDLGLPFDLSRQIELASIFNADCSIDELKKRIPILSKEVLTFLSSHNYDELDKKAKKELLTQTFDQLLHGEIALVRKNYKVTISLLPEDEVIAHTKSPIEASNLYLKYFFKLTHQDNTKAQLLKQVQNLKTRKENFIKKTGLKLQELQDKPSYKYLGDLLMANMHSIEEGSTTVELSDFYESNKLLKINLKKELSPQKNAERFYKKGKNEALQLNILKKNIEHKEQELFELMELEEEIKKEDDIKNLNKIQLRFQQEKAEEQQKVPYFRFNFMGYEIRVGKNAKDNDDLTFHHSHKEDLWLHARGYTGSHVVIKHQSGEKIPTPVLEKAASLAAYYSKGKSENLCPVSYTKKKHVRKPKGSPHGAVVMQNEIVLIVSPSKEL